MIRMSLIACMAASLLLAGPARAETKPTDKPATPPKAQPAPPKKAAAKARKVTYACEGGVNLLVRYPTEAEAKSRKAVKVTVKDTTYNVRPVAGTPDKYENKAIKLVFQTKGDEATLEREGKPLAEKCKSGKPST